MAFAHVYLFAGPEIGERNSAVESLRQQARRTLQTLDEYTFYAHETSVSDVVGLLCNESLFAAARFIVLKNAELIKKKDDIARIAALSAGAEDTKGVAAASVLVLVSDSVSVDKKLEAAVPKNNRKIFWELFENRKEQWLVSFFQRAGFSIEPEAVQTILELVENNTDALRTECSRFMLCLERGSRVTAAAVEQFIAHNREESPFTLFDALSCTADNSRHRLETALDILHKIRLSKDSSSIQLLAGLTFCFRKLRQWHSLYAGQRGVSEFDLKKAGFSSKKARTQYTAAARMWSAAQTEAILALIARTDMAMRTLGQAAETTLLELLLYSIVLKRGAMLEPVSYDWP